MEAAPAGSYDEIVARDVAAYIPALAERFDLIVSWQALEHVRDVGRALCNLRLYLRPGGKLVAQVSGRYSAFAVANRMLPHRVAVDALNRLAGRPRESVFPAHYDRCYFAALTDLLDPAWAEAEVIPRYKAADYFNFAPLVRRAYLAYEDWTLRAGHRDLATHYIISARR
jgi:SAM-dependent methyltransferase